MGEDSDECGSEKEGKEHLKSLIIANFFADKYIDVNEFETSPIKGFIKYEYRPVTPNFKTGVLYAMKKMKVTI